MEAVQAAGTTSGSFYSRHEFLIRRLHSLSGLIPVGAYMVVHLLINASVLNGPETFQKNVDTIHSLGLILPVVEWGFIFIPILFHAIVGVLIMRGGRMNPGAYPLPKNLRYTLQRVTGMIAFVYIVYHVLHMHWMGKPLGGGHFDPHYATSTAATALQSNIFIEVAYAIGILACVFHLANGIWTMGITWGVWTTPAAQKRADYVCIAFGVGLALVGLSGLFGMTNTDPISARAYEEVKQREHEQQRKQIEEALSKSEAVSVDR